MAGHDLGVLVVFTHVWAADRRPGRITIALLSGSVVVQVPSYLTFVRF